MNETERKKYDEAEASGLLPRLLLVVQSFYVARADYATRRSGDG